MTHFDCLQCEIWRRSAIEAGYAGAMCEECFHKSCGAFYPKGEKRTLVQFSKEEIQTICLLIKKLESLTGITSFDILEKLEELTKDQ